MKQYGTLDLRNMDCMDLMKAAPDNHWDLAIVDPPYFENGGDSSYYRSRVGGHEKKPLRGDSWKIPGAEYFSELLRVSRRQIIWGCNYYAKHIPHSGRIVWDKVNDNTPFSQCDIASYSEGVKLWLFRYKWNGMIQQDMKNKEHRIHPTQKPVALYRWLLQNYAESKCKHCDDGNVLCKVNNIQTDCEHCEGSGIHQATILDTHLGSGSIAIACYYMGFDLTGSELDPDYYAAMMERIDKETRQQELF
jgi:site-specific DNA-methyltransferase (adenine-specific)